MADWLFNLPVVWMSVVVLAATGLVAAAIYGVVMALATERWGKAFKATSPVLLTPLAVVFGLLIGFLAAQVWGDSERAQTAVSREAGALRAVILLAASFPGEPESRLRAMVRRHIEEAVSHDWPAMARQSAKLTMFTTPDVEALQFVLSLKPQSEAQIVAQRELVASLQNALDARRQRLVISRSTINGVKWTVVNLLAVLLLLTLALVHCDNRVTAALSMAIFTVAVAACLVLIASYNRPFTGEISIGPDLLLEVQPDKVQPEQ